MTQYEVDYGDDAFDFAKCWESAKSGYAAANREAARALYDFSKYYKKVLDDESVQWLRKAAHQGDLDAMYHLGIVLRFGDIYLSAKDKDRPALARESFEWILKAAEQGNVLAQQEAGIRYEEMSNGRPEYLQESFKWYAKVAKYHEEHAMKGSAWAQHSLGLDYENGKGVQKDLQKAEEWYAKAAKQFREEAENGDANAMLWMRDLYMWGHGVPKDESEAAKWSNKADRAKEREADTFRKAAEKGDIFAQSKLSSWCYNKGNTEEAIRLAKDAWKKGCDAALWNLQTITLFERLRNGRL